MNSSSFNISRLIWLALAAVVICVLLYQLRNALLPFVVGGALAYILDPFVTWLERRIPGMSSRPALKRVLLIALIFAVAAIVAAIALIAGITILIHEIQAFINELPRLIEASRITVERLDAQLTARLPEEVVVFIHDGAQDLGSVVVSAATAFAARTYGVVSQTMSLLFGLAMVPLILFYILKDKGKIIEGMLNTLSPEPRKHTRNVLGILNGVFSAYIRGQLLLGVIVGVFVFLGLWLLGVPFAPVLGLVAGITELIPVIGPWLGAIPGLLVVLATAPEKFVWVALLYLGVQFLENSLLVPRIQSESLNLHPVMVLAALIVGSEVAGLWGIILGPPLAAAGRGVLLYFLSVWRDDASGDADGDVAVAAADDDGERDGDVGEEAAAVVEGAGD